MLFEGNTLFDELEADKLVGIVKRWHKFDEIKERNSAMLLTVMDGKVIEITDTREVNRDDLVAIVNEAKETLELAEKDLLDYDKFVLGHDNSQAATTEPVAQAVIEQPIQPEPVEAIVLEAQAEPAPEAPQAPVEGQPAQVTEAVQEAQPEQQPQPIEPVPIVIN